MVLLFSYVFVWFKSSALAQSSVILWFPIVFIWFSYGLLCCWLIWIVGPRSIFNYHMVLHGFAMVFVWFCIVFLWFCYVSNWFKSSALARSSVILWFPFVFIWFSYGLLCCWLILIVGPRPIFNYYMVLHGFAIVFVWFCIVFLWFCYVSNWFYSSALARSSVILWFRMALIYCSYGFAMLPVDFNRRPSPDLQLSYDFIFNCIVFLWVCYVSGWF